MMYQFLVSKADCWPCLSLFVALSQGAADIDLFVFVLTGGSWPYQPQTCAINLPGPLARYE